MPEQSPLAASVRLDPAVKLLTGPDGVTVLLGGSPLRLLRLRSPADQLVRAVQRGSNLAEAIAVLPEARRQAGHKLIVDLVSRGLAHPVPHANPTRSLTDVSIVIPVHNRGSALRRLLETVRPLSSRGAAVIVVDDGSTDGTGEVTRLLGATVIRRDAASGPAAARNAGLAEVATPIVAFLDSDTIPIDGWLDLCLSHLDETTGIRNLATVDVVAPRIVGRTDVTTDLTTGQTTGHPASDTTPRSKIAQRIEKYEHVRSPLDLGPDPAIIAPMTRVAYVPSAALVCRTEALRSANGFDEALQFGEDVDLLWRLHRNGRVMRFEPLAQVTHAHRTTPVQFVRRRFEYGTSAAALDRRHPGLVPPAVLSPWSAGAIALAIAHPLGAVVGAGVVVVTAGQLPKKIPQLRPSDARALAFRGHLAAGEQCAESATRTWFPLTALAACFSPRARWMLVLSLIVPGLREHHRRTPALGRATFLALRAIDDAAYGFGVWAGSLRARSVGALLPKIHNWPGRPGTGEDTKV